MNLKSLLIFLKNPEIYKYIIVGAINGILVIVLTVILTSLIGIFYVISVLIAYEVSICVNFFMHDKWTFNNVKKNSKSYIRFIKYNIFSLIGLGINTVVLVFLTDHIGLHYEISEAVAILVTFIFNYIMSKKISFRN